MATNTGKRRCKNCQKEFVKKSPLDYLCSPECVRSYKNAIEKAQSYTYMPKEVKRNTEIKKVSDNNKYSQSDGTKISAKALERNIHIAKGVKVNEMIENYGYVFCEDCNEFGIPAGANEMELKIIDCSHQIGVKEAKETGRAELCYDVDNIRMRCRVHHRKHDKTE